MTCQLLDTLNPRMHCQFSWAVQFVHRTVILQSDHSAILSVRPYLLCSFAVIAP